jgi:hypothetical protein
MLRVKVDIFQPFYANRLESSQANVEGDGLDLDIVLFQMSEDLGGEVKASRGGGGRAEVLREDRLVAIAVLWAVVAVNVRRERHVADFVEDSVKILRRGKPECAFAEFAGTEDFRFEERLGFGGGVEEEVFAGLNFSAGADEGAPVIFGKLLG